MKKGLLTNLLLSAYPNIAIPMERRYGEFGHTKFFGYAVFPIHALSQLFVCDYQPVPRVRIMLPAATSG
jgi:hypothetical protein